MVSDRWDEDGGGETDANGELFGKPMRAFSGVNKDEIGEDQTAEDEVEMDRFGHEMGQQHCEGDGSKKDSDDEGAAVAMVEVVAGFERSCVERVFGEQACVEKPVGDVQHPDGEEHGEDADLWKTNVIGRGDEPGPECGDGWGVE